MRTAPSPVTLDRSLPTPLYPSLHAAAGIAKLAAATTVVSSLRQRAQSLGKKPATTATQPTTTDADASAWHDAAAAAAAPAFYQPGGFLDQLDKAISLPVSVKSTGKTMCCTFWNNFARRNTISVSSQSPSSTPNVQLCYCFRGVLNKKERSWPTFPLGHSDCVFACLRLPRTLCHYMWFFGPRFFWGEKKKIKEKTDGGATTIGTQTTDNRHGHRHRHMHDNF